MEIDKVALYDDGNRQLTSFEKLVLVLEDRRYFSHSAVDYVSAIRDLSKAIFRLKHGGASTIDMQFVRTATGYREKTLKRKFHEIMLAAIIQWRYSKIQILRSYLSCAYFGSKMTGAEEASRRAFNKELEMLSILEAAELASMLVYPRPLRPQEKWRQSVSRRAIYGRRRLQRFEECFKEVPSWK